MQVGQINNGNNKTQKFGYKWDFRGDYISNAVWNRKAKDVVDTFELLVPKYAKDSGEFIITNGNICARYDEIFKDQNRSFTDKNLRTVINQMVTSKRKAASLVKHIEGLKKDINISVGEISLDGNVRQAKTAIDTLAEILKDHKDKDAIFAKVDMEHDYLCISLKKIDEKSKSVTERYISFNYDSLSKEEMRAKIDERIEQLDKPINKESQQISQPIDFKRERDELLERIRQITSNQN